LLGSFSNLLKVEEAGDGPPGAPGQAEIVLLNVDFVLLNVDFVFFVHPTNEMIPVMNMRNIS
jgi:hypothetical protein